MPTLLGGIFLGASAYCFMTNKKGLLGVLLVATIFQASGAIKFGERGIQCVYLVELFIVLRALLDRWLGQHARQSMPRSRWLLAFCCIAVASAVIGPRLFAGIPVYDPIIGIDAGLLVRPPLNFGLNNITQALFLLAHVSTAYAARDLGFSLPSIKRAFLVAFYLVLLCVVAQSICRITNLPFPDSVIRNNPDIWDLANSPSLTRKPGTFLEPSFAGGFFVLYATSFMAEYLSGRGSMLRVALAILGVGMVTSSGSILSLAVLFVALVCAYPPVRLPRFILPQRVVRILWIALVPAVAAAAALLLSSDLRAVLTEQTVAKGGTGSFFNRTMSDLYALVLFAKTYGIGVGLGSNRASSLLTTMMSTVGGLGLVAFCAFCIPLFWSLKNESAWVKWAGFGLLVNMVVDIPDVTFPLLWTTIIVAIAWSVESAKKQILQPELVAP